MNSDKPRGDALYAEGLSREEQMAEILRHALHCGYLPIFSADEAKRALARSSATQGLEGELREAKLAYGRLFTENAALEGKIDTLEERLGEAHDE